jgi:Spy/CpxP family protein refolding chaperone
MTAPIVKKMLVIAALAAFLPTAAWTMPPDGGDKRSAYSGKDPGPQRNMKGERHLERMAMALQLTATQREQVQAILAAEREQTAPLQTKMHQERGALRAAIHAGTAQEADIRTQVAAQAETKAELMIRRAATRNEIHALLTPEQKVLAAEQFESRRSGSKGHKNRCGMEGRKGL